MPYTKVHEDWEDFPSTATPLDQAALEQIEQGIASATTTAEAAETPAGAQAKATAAEGTAISTASADATSKANAAQAAAAADATAKADAAKARATHTGVQPISSLDTTGTADATTFLRGDGSWQPLAAPGGWALKSVTTVRRTAGDLNLQTATMAWANTSTALDLVAAAAVGDRARVHIQGLAGNEARAAFIDAVTLDSGGLPRISFANQAAPTSAPPFFGVPSWRCHASAYTSLAGFAEWVLAADDIVTGNTTIRFRSCTDSNGAKSLFAGTNYALTVKLEIWTPT